MGMNIGWTGNEFYVRYEALRTPEKVFEDTDLGRSYSRAVNYVRWAEQHHRDPSRPSDQVLEAELAGHCAFVRRWTESGAIVVGTPDAAYSQWVAKGDGWLRG